MKINQPVLTGSKSKLHLEQRIRLTTRPKSPARRPIQFSVATEADREAIYRIRHAVYARELSQHSENCEGRLLDALDVSNAYIVAKLNDEILGFISITPPTAPSFSIDKYLSREQLPFPFNQKV